MASNFEKNTHMPECTFQKMLQSLDKLATTQCLPSPPTVAVAPPVALKGKSGTESCVSLNGKSCVLSKRLILQIVIE